MKVDKVDNVEDTAFYQLYQPFINLYQPNFYNKQFFYQQHETPFRLAAPLARPLSFRFQ